MAFYHSRWENSRLGDFYETFENDAKTAARELELVLTSRSFSKDVRLPMAGVTRV
jgi:DNA mismatch repair protein MutS